MCVTDRHDMTLAVTVVLNPNTTNQTKIKAFEDDKQTMAGTSKFLLDREQNIVEKVGNAGFKMMFFKGQ